MDGKDIDSKKKGQLTKVPKVKLSTSYVLTQGQRNSFYENESPSPRPSDAQCFDHTFDENSNLHETSNFNILVKKNSLRPNEVTPSQLNQMLGEQAAGKLSATPQKEKPDPFYELYKDGYGDAIEARQIVDQTKGCKNPHNSTSGEPLETTNNKKTSNDLLVKDLLKSKNQIKPAPASITKYKHVEPRYMNSVKDTSKSPQGKTILFLY